MSKSIKYTVNGCDIVVEDGGLMGEYGEFIVTMPFHLNEKMDAEREGREPKQYRIDNAPVVSFVDFESMIHMVRNIERLSAK